ncbi:MAG: AAA family ATPase [Nitrosomonadales bacterium]|nr:AAA family ATPase [Nitrosomonadales bacterium]
MNQAFVNDLGIYIRAGYPIVTIVSSEEDRTRELVEEMLRQEKEAGRARKLFVWTISRGLVDARDRPASKEDTRPPERALAFVARCGEEALFLFKDFHPYLKDASPGAALLIRQLRDLVPEMKGSRRTLLWLSPLLQIPPELQKDVTVVDLPLPAESEYRQVVEQAMAQARANPAATVALDEDAIDAIVKACRGLTRSEAENALYKAVVSRHGLTGKDVRSILDEKEQIIRKSGILEYTAAVEDFSGVGGLGQLKRWLKQRNEGFSQKARDFGLPNPRGVMLVGVPGCGKSLCAKAVASEWQKPLLKFDLGRVFAGLVGESEERMRRALSVAENVAPCVLWIDEMEKGLAGIGGAGDSGVATRVFGTLLTWMEEKTQPVFVVATANNIDLLPPELLRKGRMDEIFFVGLPAARDRADILMIHLARRQRAPADFDIPAVVHATEGFSGAELEEVVVDALYEAYSSSGRTLKTEHLLGSAREIIPLSRSRSRDIETLRQWAAIHCRMAAESGEQENDPGSAANRRARALDI